MDFQQGQALLLLVDKKPFENWMRYYINKETYSISTTADFAVPNKKRTKRRNFLVEVWLHGNSLKWFSHFEPQQSFHLLTITMTPSWPRELGWVWTTESVFSLIIPILSLQNSPKRTGLRSVLSRTIFYYSHHQNNSWKGSWNNSLFIDEENWDPYTRICPVSHWQFWSQD